MSNALRTSVIGCAVLTLACHGNSTSPSSSTSSLPSTLAFTFLPIDPALIDHIVPLGNLNPPAHTLPTNHIYFYHQPVNAVVTAPAGGQIFEARRGTDDALYVQATSRTMYYFGHLLLDAGIVTGGSVTAGQRVGMTAATVEALDLGVSNDDVTLFFVRPDRYIPFTIHADSPLKYFNEPMRSALYAKVQRQGADKDGKINFDQAGRLAGNWFVQGLAASTTENVENGPSHLSFARGVSDPSINVVSIGGALGAAGVFSLSASAPDPATVSMGSGRVAYVFADRRVLLVQLVADDQIRIELLPAGTPSSADFTAAAMIYTR